MTNQLINAPLCFTVVQIRFNPVTDIASYITKIQDRFRRIKFDSFTQDTQQNLVAEGNQIQFRSEVSYKMGNFEGTESFILGPEHLAFQTTNYSVWKNFKSTFMAGLEIVHSELELSTTARLGLRYIDAITDIADEELTDYIHEGVLSFEVDKTLRHYTYSEALSAAGDDQLLIKTLIKSGQFTLPPDVQASGPTIGEKFANIEGLHVVLDFDSYNDKATSFGINAVAQKLDELHKTTEVAFIAATTEQARGKWA